MTHKEIFEALLSGKKLKHIEEKTDIYNLNEDGYLVNQYDERYMIGDPDSYSIHKEPAYQVLFLNQLTYNISEKKYLSLKDFNKKHPHLTAVRLLKPLD